MYVCNRIYMCILIHVFPSWLLLMVYLEMFDVFVSVYALHLSHADVAVGLLITSSRHLFVLVYLCNKLVIVVAIGIVYCS